MCGSNVHRHRVSHTAISMPISRGEEHTTITGVIQGDLLQAVSFNISAWLIMEWHAPYVNDGERAHNYHKNYIK